MRDKIKAVYAKHLDRDKLLGYAVGEDADIYAFYDAQSGYGIYMKDVVVTPIPKGFAHRKECLLGRRRELEAEIAEIERQIRFPK